MKPGWTCMSSSSRRIRTLGATYATTAVKEFTYYVTLYGARALHHTESG